MASEIKESSNANPRDLHFDHNPDLDEEATEHQRRPRKIDTKGISIPPTNLHSPPRTPKLPALTHSAPTSPLSTTSRTSSTTSSSLPGPNFSSLETSKHSTSFNIRNQSKLLKLNTTLSGLHLHISSAYRTRDQAAFNDLHARITRAGDGLPSFAAPVVWKKADAESRKFEPREVRDVDACLNEDGWYQVKHERREDEGGEYEVLCDERLRQAREEYEVRVGWRESGSEVEADGHESEVEANEEGEQSDGSELEWEDEIRTPTVVASKSLEDKESVSPSSKISAIGLDGLSI